MARLKPHERLRIASMGKLHDVTAIFAGGFVDDRVEATNAYLAKNRDEGVIAEIGDVTFVAGLHGGELYMTTDRHVGPAALAEELLSALKALVENPRPAMGSGGTDEEWNARYARYEAAFKAAAALVAKTEAS